MLNVTVYARYTFLYIQQDPNLIQSSESLVYTQFYSPPDFEGLAARLQGVPKKSYRRKIFILTCSLLQFTVSEFIWIHYICKFCLVYQLCIWTHLGKDTAVFQRRMCFFFMCATSVEKQVLNLRNTSFSHCFRNSSLTVIWNNLRLFNYKRIKINLEFGRKKRLL